MADTKVQIRLKTPEDEDGNRKDMFPVTSTDEVIIPDDPDGQTLTEKLDGMIELTTIQPTHPCLWLNPMETEVTTP